MARAQRDAKRLAACPHQAINKAAHPDCLVFGDAQRVEYARACVSRKKKRLNFVWTHFCSGEPDRDMHARALRERKNA